MNEEAKKNLKWWLKTIGEGLLWTGGYYATDLLQLFPEHTIANQIALPVGFLLGFLVRKTFGMRKELKKDQLPSGMTRLLKK